MKYSLPYARKIFDYLNENKILLNKVSDVFFSDDAFFPSSRLSQLNFSDWEELIRIKREFNIGLNYVLNPTVWGNKVYSPIGKIEFLKNIDKLKKRGVDTITLNNTMLLNDKDIRKILEGFTLKNSVNNQIINLEQVMFLVEELNLNHIFLGRDINRNLDEIKKISNYAKPKGVVLHILANEFCLNRCPYKLFCDSLISQTYQCIDEANKLNDKRKSLSCGDNWKISEYLKCGVIYPKQIPILSEYVDIFKIGGRLSNIATLRLTLDAYLKEEDTLLTNIINNERVSGYGLKLSELPEVYLEKTLNCKTQCHSCKYCEKTF